MLKILFELWEIYGIGTVQLVVICWFGWKFMTNHWQHFMTKINEMHKDIKANRRAVDRLRDRVSRLEGKVDK